MKDKIIHLIASEDSRNPMTDEEIAETLGIFRETVTNIRKEAGLGDSRERRKAAVFQDMKELLNMDPDLTERGLTRCLAERGYVIGKYAVGKLKEELLKEWQPEPEYGKTGEEIQDGSRFFSKVIGYAGSMKSQIKQVQAAILYPPKGLHCLLYGPSGVGKSYLAEIMHEYAVTTDNFASDAPYFAFNCADYADNPQLLLSQLFGYSKGAFTGASENKKGIVEQCDGGILFLDEVHRLPPEGQEILFYLMDKGKFRRLGETEAQRESHLMIIAATTEDPRSSLLLTFRRRIPMMIEIPSLKEFMSYLRPYRRDGILAAFCIVTETIFELVIPLVMASIVDVGVANGDRRYILAKGAQMILFALIALILGQGSAIFSARFGHGLGAELRRAEFARLQEFSFANTDHFTTSSLVTRLTGDVTAIQNSVATGLRPGLRSPIMMLTAMTASFLIHGTLHPGVERPYMADDEKQHNAQNRGSH